MFSGLRLLGSGCFLTAGPKLGAYCDRGDLWRIAEGELGALREPELTSNLGEVFSMASGVGAFDIPELRGRLVFGQAQGSESSVSPILI